LRKMPGNSGKMALRKSAIVSWSGLVLAAI
jgi:hypothetical protein